MRPYLNVREYASFNLVRFYRDVFSPIDPNALVRFLRSIARHLSAIDRTTLDDSCFCVSSSDSTHMELAHSPHMTVKRAKRDRTVTTNKKKSHGCRWRFEKVPNIPPIYDR